MAACSTRRRSRRAGLRVEAIHDERGYRRIRRELARQYDVGARSRIEVVDVDLEGDRRLIVHHKVLSRPLQEDTRRVLQHVADLWGYEVVLREVDQTSDTVLKEHTSEARPVFF